MPDKYKATWVSHSSINDFMTCPRLYYLRSVYKDPRSGNKITVISPPLALGQAVHEVIESLSILPTEDRLTESLVNKFKTEWKKVSGKKGGFFKKSTEDEYKQRGIDMIKKVEKNPGPIKNKAVKITRESFPPHYWLSEDDEIMLSGKIDWLEYLADSDSVHIIDFKTGKNQEDSKSLQLPIYHLLVTNTQKRNVDKASYWYLNHDDEPIEQKLPDLDKSYEEVMKVAKKIKLARQLERFVCPKDGCRYCLPFEEVLKGNGELVGHTSYQDIYVVPLKSENKLNEEIVL